MNSITISNNDKLQSLIGIVNGVAPLLVKSVYKYMAQFQPGLWSDHCHYHDDNAAAFMVEMLKDSINGTLPQSIVNEIDSRYSMALEYQIQAQYAQLNIEEQQDQDAFWDRQDEQTAFDDKVNMYYNEY